MDGNVRAFAVVKLGGAWVFHESERVGGQPDGLPSKSISGCSVFEVPTGESRPAPRFLPGLDHPGFPTLPLVVEGAVGSIANPWQHQSSQKPGLGLAKER